MVSLFFSFVSVSMRKKDAIEKNMARDLNLSFLFTCGLKCCDTLLPISQPFPLHKAYSVSLMIL